MGLRGLRNGPALRRHGHTRTSGACGYAFGWCTHLAEDGEILNKQFFGNLAGQGGLSSACLTADGGCIALGGIAYPQPFLPEAWFIKIGVDGEMDPSCAVTIVAPSDPLPLNTYPYTPGEVSLEEVDNFMNYGFLLEPLSDITGTETLLCASSETYAPGDCNGNSLVSIGEVQGVINGFLGSGVSH